MILNVLFDSEQKKIVYAEAEGDFVDGLVKLLLAPHHLLARFAGPELGRYTDDDVPAHRATRMPLSTLQERFFVDNNGVALKEALLLTTSTSKRSTTSTYVTTFGSFRGGDGGAGGFDDAFHKITCTHGYNYRYESLPSLLKPGHKFTVANNLEISTGSSIFCVELLRRHQPDSTRWTNFFGLKLELEEDDFRAIARSALSGRARVLDDALGAKAARKFAIDYPMPPKTPTTAHVEGATLQGAECAGSDRSYDMFE